MQEDVVLRALRFLEGFLQRDALQKAAFLKDLEGLWSRCDTRVLRYRVLPPLLAESRNEALQPVILPLVMRIVQKQESQAGHFPGVWNSCGLACTAYLQFSALAILQIASRQD